MGSQALRENTSPAYREAKRKKNQKQEEPSIPSSSSTIPPYIPPPPTRMEKTVMGQGMVDAMQKQHGGGFWEMTNDGKWHIVPNEGAPEKVNQTLRDNTAIATNGPA